MIVARSHSCFFFFFNDTATTEIYTLSLHDALPIFAAFHRARPEHTIVGAGSAAALQIGFAGKEVGQLARRRDGEIRDRKSTRLNSSHANISYAVFCLKKKKKYMTKAADLTTTSICL